MRKVLSIVSGVLLASQIQAAPDTKDVLSHYADMAHAKYEDSLTTARDLQEAINQLVKTPTEEQLTAAKGAWIIARVPYQQTEVFRFGNAIVDDWEGKVNAWPLDEGLIDYVMTSSYGTESDENPHYTANVVANEKLTVGGTMIDATNIDKKLLGETLHELDEVEANVATGYHAIEFLLWGQDLNGTGPGAGNRPATDYDPKNCTGGHCERRAAYLQAAADLLVEDLEWMTAQWDKDGGAGRKAVMDGDPSQGIAIILTGMGSLSYGELAGERMKLGLMLHDPEEEHDCFSDNTHWSHYYDVLGIKNVYTGTYKRLDGTMVSGPSLSDIVAAKDAEVDKELRGRLDATLASMQVLVDSAEKDGVAYDQLIGADNAEGNAKVQSAVDALVAQTKSIEKAVKVAGVDAIEFEGSDSLDAPEKVMQ